MGVKLSIAKRSFNGGAISPQLYGRTDLDAYNKSVRIMKNFFPHAHGGASNRGGTRFIAETQTSTDESRLIPFQFSASQAYALEIGDLYMRVFTDKGQVIGAAGNGRDIVNAGVFKWTASGSGTDEYYLELDDGGDPGLEDPATVYENGIEISEGSLGSLALNEWGYGDNDTLGYSTVYARIAGGADPDTGPDGYLEAGQVADGAIYEMVTQYVESQVKLIKYTQSADVIYFFHPKVRPQKISRYGSAYWITENLPSEPVQLPPTSVAMGGGLPWSKYVVTSVSIEGEESRQSLSVGGAPGTEITWVAAENASYYKVYRDANVNGVYGYIGKADGVSFTEDTGGSTPLYDDSPPQVNIDFFSNFYTNKPGVGTFFEQRLVIARSDETPQAVWGSVTGDYENFTSRSPAKPDDSYKYLLDSARANEIRWLVPLNELVIGTSGGEWKMSGGSQSDSITPSNVSVKQQSAYGVADTLPVVIGNTVIFIEGSKKVVRDLTYSFEADGYTGNDLTVLAPHLFEDYSIIDMCYQQSPNSIVWCVRNDGALLGLTYLRDHQVWGWHQHETDGNFESVVSISTSEGSDDVYMIVKRAINGATKRYVEVFSNRLPVNANYEKDISDAFIVDSGLTLDVPETITGATQASPIVLTITANTFSDGDKIDIDEILGMTELNGKRYTVANKATNTVELTDEDGNDVDGTGYEAYASGGKAREAVTTLSGLDHLEGKEVAILANGSVSPSQTVVSGSITLPLAASRVQIGLPYTCDIELLDFDFPTETGSTVQDRIRNIVSAVLRLDNTRDLLVGPNEDNLEQIYFRTDEDYNFPTRLFTGDKEVNIVAGDPTAGRMFIRVKTPLPITVLSVIARMTHGGN